MGNFQDNSQVAFPYQYLSRIHAKVSYRSDHLLGTFKDLRDAYLGSSLRFNVATTFFSLLGFFTGFIVVFFRRVTWIRSGISFVNSLRSNRHYLNGLCFRRNLQKERATYCKHGLCLLYKRNLFCHLGGRKVNTSNNGIKCIKTNSFRVIRLISRFPSTLFHISANRKDRISRAIGLLRGIKDRIIIPVFSRRYLCPSNRFFHYTNHLRFNRYLLMFVNIRVFNIFVVVIVSTSAFIVIFICRGLVIFCYLCIILCPNSFSFTNSFQGRPSNQHLSN